MFSSKNSKLSFVKVFFEKSKIHEPHGEILCHVYFAEIEGIELMLPGWGKVNINHSWDNNI